MSELAFSNNEELYRELGLEEWLEPRTFEEDPILSERIGVPAYGDKDFLDFFAQREFEGSPSEGYSELASRFIRDLQLLVDGMRSVNENDSPTLSSTVIPVAVKPLSDRFDLREASRLRQGEMTSSINAFRGEIEFLLRTGITAVDSEGDERGRTLYRGRYYDPIRSETVSLFLLERHDADDKGPYVVLELRSGAPTDMLKNSIKRAPKEEKPFVTTGEEEEMRAGVIDLIAEHGVKSIDEAQIVQDYFGRHRKAA